MNPNLTWPLIRARLKEAVLVLPHFFRNPVQGMRNLPPWEWPEMLILQSAFAAICFVLTNAIGGHIAAMIAGILAGPITVLLTTGIAAGFFYYLFMFYFHRQISFREIYLQLVFAAIPYMLCNILAPLVPVIVLLGAACTSALLFISFTDNFHLDRIKVRNVLGAMYAILALSLIFQLVTFAHKRERMREKATPESIDILEKEMNTDN